MFVKQHSSPPRNKACSISCMMFQERLLDLERKDQENRVMQKYLDKLCEEEAEKLEKRHAEQIQLREDLHKCNADIIRRKELSKEQVKM